jgi:hypothetical protein
MILGSVVDCLISILSAGTTGSYLRGSFFLRSGRPASWRVVCNRVKPQESVLYRKGEINLEESWRSHVGSPKFE